MIAADTALPAAESKLLAISLVGMAQVSARYWVSPDSAQIPLDDAKRLVSSLAWRGLRGVPLTGEQTGRESTRPVRPWTRADRAVLLGLVVLVGVGLLASTVSTGYRAYRFGHFAVTVDALILDSDLGCFGAYGGGSGMGTKSSITYTVEFPYAGTSTGPTSSVPATSSRRTSAGAAAGSGCSTTATTRTGSGC